MIVDERTRRLVHEWAASAAGPDVADALMAMLPPFSTEELATGADLERMTAGLRGEMSELRAELRGEMSELRGELRGEMSELRGEMSELRGEMSELRDEMAQLDAGLRGEMVTLSARIDGLLPRQLLADVPLAFAVAGLVLVAAKLA
jgi:hypothetical protein